jgi:hypothetical protein
MARLKPCLQKAYTIFQNPDLNLGKNSKTIYKTDKKASISSGTQVSTWAKK